MKTKKLLIFIFVPSTGNSTKALFQSLELLGRQHSFHRRKSSLDLLETQGCKRTAANAETTFSIYLK